LARPGHDSTNVPGRASVALLVAMLGLLFASGARAHLMPARSGTLNVVDDGAFLVLSLPVSAFPALDGDGDGLLSVQEFGTHRGDILDAVRREVRLLDEHGPRPLQGLMVSPVSPHGKPADPAARVVVLGRFSLADAGGGYRFEADLFGTAQEERTLRVSLARKSDDRRQLLILTPGHSAGDVFPSPDTDHPTARAERR